jgi:hypothetical protein
MTTPARTETVVKHDSHIHSVPETQYRYTLHEPHNYNDGTAVPQYWIDHLENDLRLIFGGFTRTEAIGSWQDDGVTYHDPQSVYSIDVLSDQSGQYLRDIAARVRNDLKQECVYVTRQTIDTWLV